MGASWAMQTLRMFSSVLRGVSGLSGRGESLRADVLTSSMLSESLSTFMRFVVSRLSVCRMLSAYLFLGSSISSERISVFVRLKGG